MTYTEDLIAKLRDTASRGVSSWGDLQQEAADELETLMKAVAAEREACAKVVQPVQEPTLQEQLDKVKADWRKAAADKDKAKDDLNKAKLDLDRISAENIRIVTLMLQQKEERRIYAEMLKGTTA